MKKNLPVTQKEFEYEDDANIFSTTDLKGAISAVNDDFVRISGFDRSELIGKNHNVVRHPDMPPAAFEDLWNTVKAGRSWMGMVKNRRKDGDHYWVNAFVTPITENGEIVEYQSVRIKPGREEVARAEKVYRYLMQGKQPPFLRRRSLPLPGRLTAGLAVALLPLAGAALMAGAAPVAVAGGVLGSLAVGAGASWYLLRPLQGLLAEARKVVTNPITQYIYTGRTDEVGELLLALRLGQAELRGVVGRMYDSAEHLSKTSESLSATVVLSTQGVHHQYTETEQVATAINEMSASIQEVAQNAVRTSESAREADTEAHSGKDVVMQTSEVIGGLARELEQAEQVVQRLEEDTANITTVLDVIRGIAEQTNLLALNAAIEAARAGEQGRGFAVVADEVRTLATRTHDSTQEIREMIEKLQEAAHATAGAMSASRAKADESVDSSARAVSSLDAITAAVTSISDMSTQIATAVEEQSNVAEEINQSINTIHEVVEMTAETSQETQQNSDTVERLAAELKKLVGQFWAREQ